MLPLPPRYEFLRALGAGAMGEVALVRDTARDATVALKRYAPVQGGLTEEGRLLFKQEYFAMASLRHPHLVAAYDLGELPDGTPFFTMEYVEGADLGAPGKLPEAEVRRLLPGLAAALGHLHGNGLVHGDLKPENMRVSTEGTVKLMDLGLLAPSGRVGGAIRGTLYYVAPEAIRQGVVDTRADLYALGAVLFHLLAGHPPFEIPDTLGLLRAHLELTPPDVRQFAPEVSAEMAALLRQLLAKEPAHRPATAADVLEALGLATGTEAGAILFGSPLVGREELQAHLRSVLRAPEPHVVWVTGPERAGKSRLLSEATAEAQILGVPTFRAEGLGTDAPAYLAVRPWLRALTERPSATRTRLAPALARLLPELGVAPLPPLEGAQERSRVLAAVAELALDTAPSAVWLVDDVDRLDPDSRELLQYLRRQNTPWRWILSAAESGAPEALPTLRPLTEMEVLMVARGLLGQSQLPGPVSERLPVLAAGLPGVAEAVVRHWAETGAIRRVGGKWEAAAAAEAFELPGGLSVALDQGFKRLPETAQRIGRTAAILGPAGELAALRAMVTELDDAAFYEGLTALSAAGLLLQEGGRFRFAQPARAEALAASWEPEARRNLHGQAARWYEARLAELPGTADRPLETVFAAAHHHLQGDAPERGVPLVAEAARRAIALHAVAVTEPLLTRALELPNLDPDVRVALQGDLAYVWRYVAKNDQALALYESEILPRLRETQGDRLHTELIAYGLLVQMKGRYDEARAAFEEAMRLADAREDDFSRIRVRVSAARVAVFQGKQPEALALLAETLELARASGLENPYARALVLYGYTLASTHHDRMEEGLAHLAEGIGILRRINNLAELQDAYNNLGNLHLHAGRYGRALDAFTAYAGLCDRLGVVSEAVFAQLNLGAVRLELGELAEARTHAARGVAMAREAKRGFPEGFGLAIEGLVRVFAGEPAEGLDTLAAGVTIARHLKNKYLELNLLPYLAEAQIHLGHWDAAGEALETARALAAETGNSELHGRLTRLEAALAVCRGDQEADLRLDALDAATHDAPGETAHAARWRGEWCYRRGRAEEAELAFERAAAQAGEDGLALVAAEVAFRRGQLALDAGRTEAARAHFEDAFRRAGAAGYVVYEMLAALAIGKLDPRRTDLRQEAPRRLRALIASLPVEAQNAFLNWPERRAALAAESGGSNRQGMLIERMTEVVSSPDPDWVIQRSVEAFVELTGAERAFLLLFDGLEVSRIATAGMQDEDPDEYSTSLAYRVLWGGEPLWIEDVAADQELANSASVVALGLRSAVGVPLVHDGRAIGVLMGDSKGLIEGFGAPELDLATAFGRFAGEAIANAERAQRFRQGFEEHEVLHRVALAGLTEASLEGFMAVVAREALALTGAERLVLLTQDLEPRMGFAGPDGSQAARTDVSSSVARWVAEHQEPLFLVDAQTDDTFQARHSVQALGLRTVMAVPAGRGDALQGILYLDTQRVGRQDDRVLHTLARMGEMVGAVLARLG